MFGFGLFQFDYLYAKMLSFRHVCSFRVLRHVCFGHVSGMFLLSACFGIFAQSRINVWLWPVLV